MKILFLINSLGAGGAERSTIELTKFLNASGHETAIVCLKRTKVGFDDLAARENIKVYYLKSGSLMSRYRQFKKVLSAEHPDVIHSVLFESNLLLRLTKFFNRKLKTVESLVNTPYSHERTADLKISKTKFFIVKMIDSLSAQLAPAYYHAITRHVYEHYKSILSIPDRRHRIIYRGRGANTKLGERVALRQDLGVEAKCVFVNAGRHEFQKGQLLILKAVSVLVKRGVDISDLKIFILGREGNYTSQLKEYIATHQLEQYITLTGFRDDVDRYLAASDVFLFPSYFEGLGGALIEGLAAGLPVISSDLEVLKEVIGDEKSALFFPTGNHEVLADHITTLITDQNLRRSLSAKSQRRYNECFMLDEVHNQMLKMYFDVAGIRSSNINSEIASQ